MKLVSDKIETERLLRKLVRAVRNFEHSSNDLEQLKNHAKMLAAAEIARDFLKNLDK